MITLKQWMECVNYRITEGSEYGWTCYGFDAYDLSSWDGDQDGTSSNIIFDTSTQEVYEVSVCDYERQRAYRLINPAHRKDYHLEAVSRSADANQAWDNVDYVDLETTEDFLAKATAIMNYEDYDDRVSIPIELPDNELMVLFKMAHERDMTFNDFVEEILRQKLTELESGSSFKDSR